MNRDMIPGVGTTLGVLAGLLLLTATTVGLAFVEMSGALHIAAAMAISAVKAGLIAAFFMHLGHEDHLTRTMAVGGVTWLAIMFLFTLTDFLTRT